MTTKILIIDDDQHTRQVLGKILVRDRATARFKPQIIEAADGVAGVEAFLKLNEKLGEHLVEVVIMVIVGCCCSCPLFF